MTRIDAQGNVVITTPTDVARGRQSSQTKSDMYFLEVKPFDQEFRMAESQAQSGGGSSIDELVNSQKEVVAATWKIVRERKRATLTIDPLRRIARKDRTALAEEGERLLAFTDPDVPAHGVRFAPAG